MIGLSSLIALLSISSCNSEQEEPKSRLAVTEETKPYDTNGDELDDQKSEYIMHGAKEREPTPPVASPVVSLEEPETLPQWFQQLTRGGSAARSDFARERTAKLNANHVVIQNQPNQFLVWKHKLKSAVWPHDQSLWEDDRTEEIYGFHGGALVNGALTCVEEIIFDADDYDEFIERVKASRWTGSTRHQRGLKIKALQPMGEQRDAMV